MRIFLTHPLKDSPPMETGQLWSLEFGGGWARPPTCKGEGEFKNTPPDGSVADAWQVLVAGAEYSVEFELLNKSILDPVQRSTINSINWNKEKNKSYNKIYINLPFKS